jgi:hypothetical protein
MFTEKIEEKMSILTEVAARYFGRKINLTMYFKNNANMYLRRKLVNITETVIITARRALISRGVISSSY